ncbi:MAG: S8 family serine peptidase [Myxococcota bacterium]
MTYPRSRPLLLTLLITALLALLSTRFEPSASRQLTSPHPTPSSVAAAPHAQAPPNPSHHQTARAPLQSAKEPLPGVNVKPGAVKVERLTWQGQTVEVARREVLLRFKPDMAPSQVADFHAHHRTMVVQRSRHHEVRRIQLDDDDPRSLAQLLDELRQDPRVAHVGPNHVMRGASPDNMPEALEHWAEWVSFLAPERRLMWHITSAWHDAWNHTPRASGVAVALLDSGVAYEDHHDDQMAYQVAPSLACTPILSPYDAVNDDAHANDDHQHGTHLASLLASDPDCGSPILGYAPGVTLIPVKVLDQDLVGTELTLVEGIYHAVEAGADIINMSLSFDSAYEASPMLLEALDAAASQAILMVAASGNAGDLRVSYPARANSVIAVGAWAMSHFWLPNLADYSNTGAGLEVLAPGGDMNQDVNFDGFPDGLIGETFTRGNPLEMGYWLQSGTSQASIAVTGLAALLLTAGVSPEHVRAHISHTTNAGFIDWTPDKGNGILDPRTALNAVGTIETATPKYYVNLVGGLRIRRKRIKAHARVQVLGPDMEPASQVLVKGRWSGIGLVDALATCTTDQDGRCSLSRQTDRSELVLHALEITQVVPPDGVWPQPPTVTHGVPAHSFFQMSPLMAQEIRDEAEETQEPTLLAFYVDPNEASTEALLGERTRLSPSYMMRDLAPRPGLKPAILLSDEASLDQLVQVASSTEGTGLGASSRLIVGLSPVMFTLNSIQLNRDALNRDDYINFAFGTGLGASSDFAGDLVDLNRSYTIINDIGLLNTEVFFWRARGTGLGASSRLVWQLQQTTTVSFDPACWPSDNWFVSPGTW